MTGCSNHSCLLHKPQGMGTNGPCHCLDELRRADFDAYRKVHLSLTQQRRVVAAARKVLRAMENGNNFPGFERALPPDVQELKDALDAFDS